MAPAFVRWRQARRLETAAEELVLFAVGLRMAAAAAGASRGIVIDSRAGKIVWTPVDDGDGDGLRRADLRAGRDSELCSERNVSRNCPGVFAGLPPRVQTPTGGMLHQTALRLAGAICCHCRPTARPRPAASICVTDSGTPSQFGSTVPRPVSRFRPPPR